MALFNDVALVWYLAPTADAAGAPAGGAAARPLASHVFQPGDFTAAERAATWVRKWKLYSAIGLVNGALAAAVTAVLSRDAAALAPALLARAALTGALHLGVSANTRYQLVNGLEVLLYKLLPVAVARLGSVAVRFGNNCAGGFLWIALSAAIRRAWVI